MANHVKTRVSINCNEKAQIIVDRWREAIEQMSDDQYKMVWRLFEVTEEEVTYEWMLQKIGSKWCYVEETWDNEFSLVSAWDWPAGLVDWMTDQVLALDEDATITVTYEDEMPNFIGYQFYDRFGSVGDGIDYDTLSELVETQVAELADVEPDSDEYFDILHEHIWDVAYQWQDEKLNSIYERETQGVDSE